MEWVHKLWNLLRSLFHRERFAEKLDGEIQFHLDELIAENIDAGMTPEEAKFAAMRTFGNFASVKEEARETWGWMWLEQIGQDLRYGFRGLRRDVGSTIFAILIVGLGIGASSTVFSVVNALLLRPLPFPRSGTTGMDFQRGKLQHPGRTVFRPPGPEPVILRSGRLVRVLPRGRQRIDGSRRAGASYERSGDRELLRRCWGWNLQSEDRLPGRSAKGKYSAPPAMLLSNSFWRRRFASDPNRGRPEADVERSAGDSSRRAARSRLTFASVFAPGTPDRCLYSLAAHG